jgi:hypothetical protein
MRIRIRYTDINIKGFSKSRSGNQNLEQYAKRLTFDKHMQFIKNKHERINLGADSKTRIHEVNLEWSKGGGGIQCSHRCFRACTLFAAVRQLQAE